MALKRAYKLYSSIWALISSMPYAMTLNHLKKLLSRTGIFCSFIIMVKAEKGTKSLLLICMLPVTLYVYFCSLLMSWKFQSCFTSIPWQWNFRGVNKGTTVSLRSLPRLPFTRGGLPGLFCRCHHIGSGGDGICQKCTLKSWGPHCAIWTLPEDSLPLVNKK